MKYILVCVMALMLAGCDGMPLPVRELQPMYFDQCLKNLPNGPQKTHYNDWAEVVSQCRYASSEMSNRPHGVMTESDAQALKAWNAKQAK